MSGSKTDNLYTRIGNEAISHTIHGALIVLVGSMTFRNSSCVHRFQRSHMHLPIPYQIVSIELSIRLSKAIKYWTNLKTRVSYVITYYLPLYVSPIEPLIQVSVTRPTSICVLIHIPLLFEMLTNPSVLFLPPNHILSSRLCLEGDSCAVPNCIVMS